MSHTTAYGWYWYDDPNWIPYTDAQNTFFEAEFSKGNTKHLKVDKDRYIDTGLTQNDILKNFTNVPSDPDLVGIQRRNDDPMKRRAVKRSKKSTTKDIFKDLVFSFYSTKPKTKYTELCDNCTNFGGKVVKSLKKDVDYLIIKPNDEKDDVIVFNEKIEEAEKLNIIPIQSAYINQCITSLKTLPDTTYILSKKPVPVVVTPVPTTSNTTSVAATTTNTTPTKTSVPIGQVGNKDSSYFAVGTKWAGVCTDETGEHYTFNLGVDSFKDGEYHGQIKWVTLDNCITKYKGKISSDHSFLFTEYEIVQGQDEVEVPSDYQAIIYGDTIVGTVNQSKFKLKLTKSPPVKVLKPDSQWSGLCTQYEKFKLTVLSRKDGVVEGTIQWSEDFNDTVTSFKGKIENNQIQVFDYIDSKNEGPLLSSPFKITYDDKVSLKLFIQK